MVLMIDGFKGRPAPNGGPQKRDNFYPDLTPNQPAKPREYGTIPEPVHPPEHVVTPHSAPAPEQGGHKPPVDESIELDNTNNVPLLTPAKPRGPRWWRKLVWWFTYLNKKQKA